MTSKKGKERDTPLYTPTFDILCQKYDPLTALVFGKIYRYWRNSPQKICYASEARMAKELNISTKTFSRKKLLLEKEGYIFDNNFKSSGGTCQITITRKLFDEDTADFPSVGTDRKSVHQGQKVCSPGTESPTKNSNKNRNNNGNKQREFSKENSSLDNIDNDIDDDWETDFSEINEPEKNYAVDVDMENSGPTPIPLPPSPNWENEIWENEIDWDAPIELPKPQKPSSMNVTEYIEWFKQHPVEK